MLIRTGSQMGHPMGRTGGTPYSDSSPVVRVTTPAKLNLFLEILGKRADGFHELQTATLLVNLCDELTFASERPESIGADGTGAGAVTLRTDVPGLSTGPENLVCKAAERLKQHTGCRAGATIELTKRIPWAAGLGGGSSDAAATLVGLNELWQLGLNSAELQQIAAGLGSDVPLFLCDSPACWCTGRGEIITPLAVTRVWDFVLVKIPRGLATADVYRKVRVPTPIAAEPFLQALASGTTAELGRTLHNRLQEAAFELAPELAALHARLRQTSAAGCLMTGSGSCMFVLASDASEAQQIADDLLSGSVSEVVPGTRIDIVQSCIATMPSA